MIRREKSMSVKSTSHLLSSRSDYGIQSATTANTASTVATSAAANSIENNLNSLISRNKNFTTKSLKLIKLPKSTTNTDIVHINGNIDEQNDDTFDDYLKKLRQQQAKMFSSVSNNKENHKPNIYKRIKAIEKQHVGLAGHESGHDSDANAFGNKVDTFYSNSETFATNTANTMDIDNDNVFIESVGEMKLNPLPFDRSSKKWTSMHTLRDSIRSLTKCVSTRSRFIKRK